jgi:hypothetical protein
MPLVFLVNDMGQPDWGGLELLGLDLAVSALLRFFFSLIINTLLDLCRFKSTKYSLMVQIIRSKFLSVH